MRRRLFALLAFAACLSSGLPGAATAQPVDVDYARDPQVAVVTWTEIPGEIADPDPTPSLVVYGDGRAVAHYPHYMKRAGDHELRLSAAEMRTLVRGLAQKGLVEFDRAAARTAARDAAAASGIERVSTDPATTVIELRLSRYRPPAAVADVLDVHKRIEWRGLRGDARDHPSVSAIQNLAAAQRDLAALAARAARAAEASP
jgi:hypothetical protein